MRSETPSGFNRGLKRDSAGAEAQNRVKDITCRIGELRFCEISANRAGEVIRKPALSSRSVVLPKHVPKAEQRDGHEK
jgi:hypothetical protein